MFTMFTITIIKTVTLAIACSQVSVTTTPIVEERGQNVCASGFYGEIVPAFRSYGPAQAFCSKAYLVSCATNTNGLKIRRLSTTCSSALSSSRSSTRDQAVLATTSRTLTTSKSSTISAKSISNTLNQASKDAVWSKLVQQGQGIISTVCSCILNRQVW